MKRDYKAEIQQAARAWVALFERLKRAVPGRMLSEAGLWAWKDASEAWHAYRPEVLAAFWRPAGLSGLEQGDPELLELALCYLEVDPYYFRSGYLKTRLFRRLRRMTLGETERQRILQAILTALRFHQGDGWKEFCRLASPFADPEFEASVSQFLADDDVRVARRAKTLLARLQGPKRREPTA